MRAKHLATAAALATTGAGASSPQSPHDQAVVACASLNTTAKLGILHGFGKIDGYSRNSGCGGVCGRDTFRWDNGVCGCGCGQGGGGGGGCMARPGEVAKRDGKSGM